MDRLETEDPEIYTLIEKEVHRVTDTIQLIAAENMCSRSVLAALGSILNNKTTEGFPGARFHGGCEFVDHVETLAVERVKKVFNAEYANVQPHSGSQANSIVFMSLLEPGDKIMGLGLDYGGHLTHGAPVSMSGKLYHVDSYAVEEDSKLLNYDMIRDQAVKFRPKLLICGASAYPRQIDFEKFRAIADHVGAYLLADVSHISGLIAGGVHPSPVPHAHFTTTSTYKPGGPRGGLILMGKEFQDPSKRTKRTLSEEISKWTFPGVQGTPLLNNVAAKAVFFNEMLGDEYRQRQAQIIRNAKVLAKFFVDNGYDVLTGGTDNHMVLMDVSSRGLTGIVAQEVLEECGIVTNKNKIPFDTRSANVTSGIRLGTPVVTKIGMKEDEMQYIAEIIHRVLEETVVESETKYSIDPAFVEEIRRVVKGLNRRFSI